MANEITWAGGASSRADVLTTELAGLLSSTWTVLGPAYDNSSAGPLDQYAALRIALLSASSAAFTPGAGAYLGVYMLQSLDGTNYDPAPSSGNASYHANVATVSISSAAATSSTAAGPAWTVLVHTPWFRLPPCKLKFAMLNGTSGKPSSSATTHTVTLFTQDDLVN